MTAWSPVPGLEASVDGEDAAMFRSDGELAPAPWRAAEMRLYPLVTADPEVYEAAVTLVREALEVLRSRCGSVAELTLVSASEVVDHCPSAHTAAALGVDPGTALDAARAVRWRELTAAAAGGPPVSTVDGRR